MQMPECHHGSDPHCCVACANERGEIDRPRRTRHRSTVTTYGPWTHAKYDGWCRRGDHPYDEGTQIHHTPHDGWVCADHQELIRHG